MKGFARMEIRRFVAQVLLWATCISEVNMLGIPRTDDMLCEIHWLWIAGRIEDLHERAVVG